MSEVNEGSLTVCSTITCTVAGSAAFLVDYVVKIVGPKGSLTRLWLNSEDNFVMLTYYGLYSGSDALFCHPWSEIASSKEAGSKYLLRVQWKFRNWFGCSPELYKWRFPAEVTFLKYLAWNSFVSKSNSTCFGSNVNIKHQVKEVWEARSCIRLNVALFACTISCHAK